jgi:hypothetical protein
LFFLGFDWSVRLFGWVIGWLVGWLFSCGYMFVDFTGVNVHDAPFFIPKNYSFVVVVVVDLACLFCALVALVGWLFFCFVVLFLLGLLEGGGGWLGCLFSGWVA